MTTPPRPPLGRAPVLRRGVEATELTVLRGEITHEESLRRHARSLGTYWVETFCDEVVKEVFTPTIEAQTPKPT
jgi:hypothetical protein